jgi:hypothetical protein
VIRASVLTACLTLSVPALLAAQGQSAQDTLVFGLETPRWAGQVTALTTNALLGGLTAGVLQELRGGSFKDGFTRGTLGGLFTYSGKRIASRRFGGAGLVGREIAAVGSSVIRNASEGRPMFERLVLPLGPVRLHVSPATRRLDASFDVYGAAWLAWCIAEPELKMDAKESLSAGTPTFRTNNKVLLAGDRLHAGGLAPAGIVLQSHVPAWGSVMLERILAHERVHVLQEDQILHTWTEPAEQWLLGKLPYGDRIAQRIDLNAGAELMGVLSPLFRGYSSRPWELEAIFFSR